MAARTSRIAAVVRRYLDELGRNGFPIREAYLFGSHAQGRVHEASDIDVAVISETFTGATACSVKTPLDDAGRIRVPTSTPRG